MDLNLTDKVVLVTGGSDGLGRALCHGLVAEGAKVALCGRDPDRVEDVRTSLVDAGGDVVGVPADVTVASQLERFCEAAVARWDRIDGVVNNAGRQLAGPIDGTDDAIWEEDLQLKLLAAVRLTRLALPHLRASQGAIVNTLAISAKAPGAGTTPTSVSRAAGMAFTKAMSKELGPDGIRVNAVLIGVIESGQWERRAAAAGTDPAAFYERIAGDLAVPLGRVGRAEEFSDLVCFLLSERAAYVTGNAINLDGGLSPTV
jgi:NAD(P)-dependent dehydrogenase (short-subunit alcohol dehydrogenase family)